MAKPAKGKKYRKMLVALHRVSSDLDAAMREGDAHKIRRFQRMFNMAKGAKPFATLRKELNLTPAQAANAYREDPALWMWWEQTNKPTPDAYRWVVEKLILQFDKANGTGVYASQASSSPG